MFPHSAIKSRNHGFSLVEIMVGIVIGLVGVLVIMQVSMIFEAQKRTTTTGADAQTNGALAVYTVEQDMRNAGYGFNMPDALGCAIKRSYEGAAISDLPLTPVVITNGAGGASDTIRMLASSKDGWSLPVKVTTDHPQAGNQFHVTSALGIAEGDLLVAYEAGKACTLLQASAIPKATDVDHKTTQTWNKSNVFPATGYSAGSFLINLGGITDRTYFLEANNLVLRNYVSTSNNYVDKVLASNIVKLQAQYGFDTRVGPQSDIRIDDAWKDEMYDADGSGTSGDNGDLRRIGAVRIAMVARSELKERPNPTTGVCDITTANPKWVAADVVLDISKNSDGTDNPDWKCYRYKVFESIIPLRNLIWRGS